MKRVVTIVLLLLLFVGLANSSAWAEQPQTPLTVSLKLDRLPELNKWVTATLRVVSTLDAPRTRLQLLLPEGAITSSRANWTVTLKKNKVVTRSVRVKFTRLGNLQVHGLTSREVASDFIWQAIDTVSFALNATGQGAPAWSNDGVGLATPDDEKSFGTNFLSINQNQAPRATITVDAQLHQSSDTLTVETPSVEPDDGQYTTLNRPQVEAPSNPGNFTVTGRWRYHDRNLPNPITRDIDQQLIEMRKGNGVALNPRCFGYTTVTGTYSLTCPHTGTNDYQVWVWSRTSFNCADSGCPHLLGVFNGPETPGGCGNSTDVSCAYPVTTPVFQCVDGGLCNAGSWVVGRTAPGEPWVGAHQMTQDLIRSWKRIFIATKHTSALAGPGVIDYPVPNGHGTHAHVGQYALEGKVWISIPPGSQLSADTVTHEYGHVVMNNLYAGAFPTNDCPNPHYITFPGASTCGWTEGFADFWALFSDELYDGDGLATNNGPVYNFAPNQGGINLESRNAGMFADGDWVEGNVAGALWDIYDNLNDNKPGAGTDLISNGISHIWHAIDVQNDISFAEWWLFFQNPAHGHPGCPALQALWNNTVSNRSEYLYPANCSVFLSPEPTAVSAPLSLKELAVNQEDDSLTFRALGKGIESIRLQVFDLSGARVFESPSVFGTVLTWKLNDASTKPLAHGVYVYLITVWGADEQSVRSELRKLMIK